MPDFTLKDLDGNDVSLSDYSGKIVVLNFWATWCIYCAEEIQDLNILDRELRDAGDAVVLAVNADEPYNTVSRFVTENGIDLEVCWMKTDLFQPTLRIVSFQYVYHKR